MRYGPGPLRAGVIVLTAVSLALCPLLSASIFAAKPASARQPFDTVPPPNATFTPPVGTEAPSPTPMSTLEPDGYFEDDDPDRPEVDEIESGDEWFGYGPVAGDPDSYLMWYTDENGTHYRLVSEDSEVLFGTIDPSTGDRRENGFDELIREREELKDELREVNLDIAAEGTQSDGMFEISLLVIGAGLGICIFLSAGACSLAVPIAGPAALGFAGLGVESAIDQANLIEKREVILDDIADQEERLEDKFDRPEETPDH